MSTFYNHKYTGKGREAFISNYCVPHLRSGSRPRPCPQLVLTTGSLSVFIRESLTGGGNCLPHIRFGDNGASLCSGGLCCQGLRPPGASVVSQGVCIPRPFGGLATDSPVEALVSTFTFLLTAPLPFLKSRKRQESFV